MARESRFICESFTFLQRVCSPMDLRARNTFGPTLILLLFLSHKLLEIFRCKRLSTFCIFQWDASRLLHFS